MAQMQIPALPAREPARRLTPKGQATRDRIVAAAAQLMFERGVAGTSTDEVQAAAEVSASQLYHYFADKRALIAAVIAWQTEAVVGGQEPTFAALDSLDALRGWRDMVVALQVQRACAGGCPLATLAGELVEADDDARTALRAAFARWADGLSAGIRRMQERGELPPRADPDKLGVALLAATQGGLILAQLERRTDPLEIALDTILDHLTAMAASTGQPTESPPLQAVGRVRP